MGLKTRRLKTKKQRGGIFGCFGTRCRRRGSVKKEPTQEELNTQLREAFAEQNTDKFEKLLQKGADIYSINNDTPMTKHIRDTELRLFLISQLNKLLHIAFAKQKYTEFEKLIEKGANIYSHVDNKYLRDHIKNHEMSAYLIKKLGERFEANVAAIGRHNNSEFNNNNDNTKSSKLNKDLHKAFQKSKLDKCTKLLSDGADINSKVNSKSLFMRVSDIHSIAFLQDNWFNWDMKDDDGNTAACLAVSIMDNYGSLVEDMIELTSADWSIPSSSGKTPLMIAAENDYAADFKTILEHGIAGGLPGVNDIKSYVNAQDTEKNTAYKYVYLFINNADKDNMLKLLCSAGANECKEVEITNIGDKLINTNAPQNTYSMEPITNGMNMIDFHNEFKHGRFYTKESFNSIIPKVNPITKEPITVAESYKAKLTQKSNKA